ncbi:MAG TPA: hypothetical protein VFX98_17330 [Longimicrobiaceae bacterium]|nr:hypothetical protein [Longimicrobiaceae bacterium]
MEPQDNKKLALQKAISAHEQAAATLADLTMDTPAGKYAEMLERVKQNLAELEAETAGTDPEDLV